MPPVTPLARLLTLLALSPLPALASQAPAYSDRPFKVVIDAGHGGADHGTIFDDGVARVAEKDVTLLIARQVARELKSKGISATLTRRGDRDLPLGGRTQLANKLGADVFLSIHMNSAQTHGARDVAEGIETYILNNATDASSRRLAHLENTVISRDQAETPQAADVALILRDLRLDANLSESKLLACSIQRSLVSAAAQLPARGADKRLNRGVKQALFHVLLGADMPSVLVEAGFLSSRRDRAMVLSPKGRKAMGKAIAGAVDRYRALRGTPAGAATLSRCKVN